jgi:hypothetical protein
MRFALPVPEDRGPQVRENVCERFDFRQDDDQLEVLDYRSS